MEMRPHCPAPKHDRLGYGQTHGARPLELALQRCFRDPLVGLILRGVENDQSAKAGEGSKALALTVA